ncbi:MAG: ClpXP protease specificity-enhancing factor SspB [Alphaproteobacteria bacterium]
MAKDQLRYDKLIEDALRGVVRSALRSAAEHGLPGAHHFYITFRTSHPGVDIPDRLRLQYPDQMTIVLQHQYWGLDVEDSLFQITLSFNKMQERLTIPFAAVTGFSDPSVQFGLQFEQAAESSVEGTSASTKTAPPTTPPDSLPAPSGATAPEERGRIVTLDSFRKK